MADGAKSSDDPEVAALVGEEPHRLVSNVGRVFADEDDFFAGECIGRVPHRRLDVLAREAWVGVEEIALRSTFAQLAENQLDRDPCPADHSLTKHHTRVDFDAIGDGH